MTSEKYHVKGKDPTQIYMFDKVFGDILLQGIVTRLNDTNFRVLVST